MTAGARKAIIGCAEMCEFWLDAASGWDAVGRDDYAAEDRAFAQESALAAFAVVESVA